MSMRVSLHSFPFPIRGIFCIKIPFPMSCSIHISCFYNSVAPHNPCGFLSYFVILHLQTGLCNCILLQSCHLHILKTLLVPKLIPVVLLLLLPTILIFHPLLLFSFPFFPHFPVLKCSFQSSNVFQLP